MNIGVLLSGGMGTRVGGSIPKQLLPLEDGRSMLEHAVEAFEQASAIDAVWVVMHPNWMDKVDELARANGWRKLRGVVAGGSERYQSCVNALKAIRFMLGADVEANVLIHDAARPFVSAAIIRSVCEALQQHEAVTVAVPATDTMYEVQNEQIVRIPPRATMMRAQTPQAFRLSLIEEAYRIAVQDPKVAATDDAGIVCNYLPDTPIFIIHGEEQNRKITFKEDFQ